MLTLAAEEVRKFEICRDVTGLEDDVTQGRVRLRASNHHCWQKKREGTHESMCVCACMHECVCVRVCVCACVRVCM